MGWVVVQVTDTVSPALNLPEWTLAFVTWIGIVGFPIALFFAWAYELTADGIKREADVDRAESINQANGRKLDTALITLLIITIGLFVWNTHSRAPDDDTRTGVATPDADGSDGTQLSSDSIAVLPLINMSAAADNAFFSGGVHEKS